MTPRRLLLAVCLPALALFCPGCASLKPDHLVFGIEHDESEAHLSRGLHTLTSTNKVDAHAVYDLRR